MNNASLNLQCLIVDFIRFRMTNDSFRVFYFKNFIFIFSSFVEKMLYVDMILKMIYLTFCLI